MTVKVQQYRTTEEVNVVSLSENKTITLPFGCFVKPINPDYLPRHIKEAKEYDYCIQNGWLICYCYYGIVAIPKIVIEELR